MAIAHSISCMAITKAELSKVSASAESSSLEAGANLASVVAFVYLKLMFTCKETAQQIGTKPECIFVYA